MQKIIKIDNKTHIHAIAGQSFFLINEIETLRRAKRREREEDKGK